MGRAAFVIHDLEQARAAAAAAVEFSAPVLLLTPQESAPALGTLWARELAAHLWREFPTADLLLLFDCGDRAALAHEALRAGAPGVCFTGPQDEARALAEIAAALGREFLSARPAALDLARLSPKRRRAAAKAWIGNPGDQSAVDAGGAFGRSAGH